jgi:hypothetical protein
MGDLAPGSGEEPRLLVRVRIRWVGGEAGRALAVAQGAALRGVLEVLAKVEVDEVREE